MPLMTDNRTRRGTAGLFVLRLAVAGILAWSGWNQLRPQTAPPLADATPTDVAVVPAMTPATDPALPADPTAAGAPVPSPEIAAPPLTPRSTVSLDGVKLDLDRDAVAGLGEMGVAAVLFFGVLVRLVSLLGAGAVAAGALAAHGTIDLPNVLDRLTQAYQANPAAALLLGAIFLALLVGGSGPVAVDRTMARRRWQRRELAAQAPPATA